MSSDRESNFDFFSGQWIFVRGVPSIKCLPVEKFPEVAFLGRSNVGKSSLVNALVGQNRLARISNTPGRTQELNFFMSEGYKGVEDVNLPVMLVDMPGYGFAKAPKKRVDQWKQLVFDYLRGRSILKRVYFLVDSRRGLGRKDMEVLELLDKIAVSYQIVLTKTDKVKRGALEYLLVDTQQLIIRRPAAHPVILITSSENGDGIKKLQETIKKLIFESQ